MSAGATHDAATGAVPLIETWRRLARSVGAHSPALRASLLDLLAAAAAQGLAWACLPPLFTALLTRRDGAATVAWLAAMSAAMLVGIALRWRAQGFDYGGQMSACTHDLRTRLGEQLRRIPLERLQSERAGEINATLLGNVDENLQYVVTIANLMAAAIVTPVVTALALLAVDWRMALLLLLVFPLLVPLYRWRRPAHGRGFRRLALARRRTSGDILEYLQGLPVLRTAHCEGERFERLRESLQQLEQVQADDHRHGAKPNLVMASVMELAILAVACVGVGLVVAGTLAWPVLVALLVIVVRFSEPLATFVIYTQVIDLIEAALGHIDALLAIEPLPQRTPARIPTYFDVRFEQVDFGYAGGRVRALAEFDARLPARRLTALVGPSGAGKSTLARLLLRQADPQRGRVLIGGVDLREIPAEQLDTLVSVVFQDVYLFDDSILANIRMARPQASDAEVEAAARTAHCHDFVVRLPQGYHTRVGDIGGRLSGGERQRISIARAILKDAPIVILDEPTAALDTESEVAVQRTVDALVRQRTVIVIAHRLSTIAAADQILVIDGGRLVEQGQHAELLAAGGRYRAMWEAQARAKAWHLGAIPTSPSPLP